MKANVQFSVFAGLVPVFAICILLSGLWGPQPSAWAASDDDGAAPKASADSNAEDEGAASSEDEEEKKRLERIRKLKEELRKLEEDQKSRTEAGGESRPATSGIPIAPADEIEIEGAPMMPVAPTSQSAAQPGQGRTSFLSPTEQGPLPPTAFGAQDGFQRNPSMMTPGILPGEQAPLIPGADAALGQSFGPGGPGLMAPPTSNPSASAGAASMDPGMGRYASFAVPQAMGELGPSGGPSALGAATKEKPFANYTPPRAISPYINLYREPASGVDNYNAFVRPIIEQQQLNVQTQYEVSKLQRTSRAQSQNLQMLDRRLNPYQRELSRPTTQQGPSQFMNLQQYYPSLQRRR